jgi:hypothetical protein
VNAADPGWTAAGLKGCVIKGTGWAAHNAEAKKKAIIGKALL